MLLRVFMKKSISTGISIVMALVMALSFVNGSAFAAQNNSEINKYSFKDDSGVNVTIEGIDKGNGVKILKQYNDGELVEEVEVTMGSTILKIKDKSGITTNVDARKILEVARDSGLVTPMATYTLLGRINYGPNPYDSLNHGIKLKYAITPETSTYTVRSYVGSVVSLVAAIISVIAVPSSVMTNVVKGVCAALGISIISGSIVNALSVTLAASISNYEWVCTDTLNENRSCTLSGKKIFIIDSNKKYSGNTYTEGLLPENWKTSTFGKSVYLSLFGVNAMTPVSYGSY